MSLFDMQLCASCGIESFSVQESCLYCRCVRKRLRGLRGEGFAAGECCVTGDLCIDSLLSSFPLCPLSDANAAFLLWDNYVIIWGFCMCISLLHFSFFPGR